MYNPQVSLFLMPGDAGRKGDKDMVHYVLLKFKPGSDLDAAEALMRQTFNELAEALPCFQHPVVYRCCVERDSNADLMGVVHLDKPEDLPVYLQHPKHVAMGQKLNPSVATRISFDRPD